MGVSLKVQLIMFPQNCMMVPYTSPTPKVPAVSTEANDAGIVLICATPLP
jgi:hypothetical protein